MACQYLLQEEHLAICVVPGTAIAPNCIPLGLKILELGLQDFTGRLVIVRLPRINDPRGGQPSSRKQVAERVAKHEYRKVAAGSSQEYDSDVSSLGLGGATPKVQKQSVRRRNSKGSRASLKRPRADQAAGSSPSNANAGEQFASIMISPKSSMRLRRKEADNVSLDEEDEMISIATSTSSKDNYKNNDGDDDDTGDGDGDGSISLHDSIISDVSPAGKGTGGRNANPTTDPYAQFGHLIPKAPSSRCNRHANDKDDEDAARKRNIIDEVAAVMRSPSKIRSHISDSVGLDEDDESKAVKLKKKKASKIATILKVASGSFTDFDPSKVNNNGRLKKKDSGEDGEESSLEQEHFETTSQQESSDSEDDSIDVPIKSPVPAKSLLPAKSPDPKYQSRESNAHEPIDQLARIMAAPPEPKQSIDEASLRDLQARIETSLHRRPSVSSAHARNEASFRRHSGQERERRSSIHKREAMSLHSRNGIHDLNESLFFNASIINQRSERSLVNGSTFLNANEASRNNLQHPYESSRIGFMNTYDSSRNKLYSRNDHLRERSVSLLHGDDEDPDGNDDSLLNLNYKGGNPTNVPNDGNTQTENEKGYRSNSSNGGNSVHSSGESDASGQSPLEDTTTRHSDLYKHSRMRGGESDMSEQSTPEDSKNRSSELDDSSGLLGGESESSEHTCVDESCEHAQEGESKSSAHSEMESRTTKGSLLNGRFQMLQEESESTVQNAILDGRKSLAGGDHFAAPLVSRMAQHKYFAPRHIDKPEDCSVDDTVSQLSDPQLTHATAAGAPDGTYREIPDQLAPYEPWPPPLLDASVGQHDSKHESESTADIEGIFLQSPHTPSLGSISKGYLLDAFAAAYFSPMSALTGTPNTPKPKYKDFADDISWDEDSVHLEHEEGTTVLPVGEKSAKGVKNAGSATKKPEIQKVLPSGKEVTLDFADDVSELASPHMGKRTATNVVAASAYKKPQNSAGNISRGDSTTLIEANGEK